MTFKVLGVGEILWDLLPAGKQLGGAPANFAYHAAALGADARAISRIGNDDLGREVLQRLQELRLPTDTIQIDPVAPTGTVSVMLDSAGHPDYTIHEGVAWDRLAPDEPALVAASQADALCFGTLGQRCEPARSSIRRLVQATPEAAWRILDVNLRQSYFSPSLLQESLGVANALKVNETELPILGKVFGFTGGERDIVRCLAERFHLRLLAYTRGDRGSLLYADGCWSDHPGITAHVADTIGAGDSFTAAMTLGLLAGHNLDWINEQANKVAAYVASQPGATPRLPPILTAPFRQGILQDEMGIRR